VFNKNFLSSLNLEFNTSVKTSEIFVVVISTCW